MRPVPGGESAGCVRLQCLFCRLCVCLPSLPAIPTALIILPPFKFACPRSFILLCVPLFIAMCARIVIQVLGPAVCQGQQFVRASSLFQQFASCKTVPLAAATRACSGGPCTGPFDFFFFPAESMILGHGGSVEFVSKMFVVNMCASPGMSCVLGRQFI